MRTSNPFVKRLFLIVLAFIIALITTELVVVHCVGYPSYGVEYKALYMPGGNKWINIRKPYSKIFNVEGKIITSVNNLGFPGLDIESIENPIVILGSSYVEAFQYQPDEIASSLFWKELLEAGYHQPILNLGCSGHDPYNSWFRIMLHQERLGFSTEDVILVLNSDNTDWFNRHSKPFTFEKPEGFGRKNNSLKMRLGIEARNASSLVELLYKGFFKSDDVDEPSPKRSKNQEQIQEVPLEYSLSQEMIDCLTAFAREYSGFSVLSIAGDPDFNSAIKEFCMNQNIPIHIKPLSYPKYMIGGAGHLNKEGNKALAEALLTLWKSTHKI